MRVALVLLAFALCAVFAQDVHVDRLFKLEKLKDLGLLNEIEYSQRKQSILDDYLGVPLSSSTPKYEYYREVVDTPSARNSSTNTTVWNMPIVWTPQVDWLVSIIDNGMPKSYSDVLPYAGGQLYWKSKNYVASGAQNYNGTRIPFDDMVAIQERALTHVGLNLYDAGVWSVALSVSGLSGLADMYHANVLYPSGTGANPQVGGLKSVRAWEPNPDPDHPPDPFYYGRDKVKNTDLPKVKMPGNVTFIMMKEGCTCPSSGCCEQVGVPSIPGNYFYRMIGPTYLMYDPLDGKYGTKWRATPAGPNPDPAQYWNLAGAIHWNDWKPITGENVWGAILGPMQVLFLKNCSHIEKFATWATAPFEVQLAISILPAAQALQSPLGSMYHCPLGTKMYPPDDEEETNVSNENNFSAWASFQSLYIVLDNYYTGGDPDLDAAKQTVGKLIKGLESWFATYLLPAPINGKNVISQGGHVTFDGQYKFQEGAQAFAIDCQTWGLLVLGSKRFDAAYSSKGVTAYGIWQDAKTLGGYYINGKLAGVGYTVSETPGAETDIWSGEWTWGAIFMARKLAREYRAAGKTEWADSLEQDAQSMVSLLTTEVIPDKDGVWASGGLVQIDGSYLYANKRFFIPWGWYANPIGATSSTGWAVLNDFDFNPFVLGGGANTTFWQTQCAANPPAEGLLEKVFAAYGY